MANVDSLDEALNVSWKENAAPKDVVDEQRAWFDEAVARMSKLKNLCNETNASAAACLKGLLRAQKYLVANSEK